MTSPTRGRQAPRPVDAKRKVSLPESLYQRIQAYADANLITPAEAIREMMDRYRTGRSVRGRERTARRINLYVNLEEYNAFMERVAANETTTAAALEAAMGEDL